MILHATAIPLVPRPVEEGETGQLEQEDGKRQGYQKSMQSNLSRLNTC